MTRKNQRTDVSVRHISKLLDGRAGYQLKSSWGHISVLEGGGHICELNLKECDGINPLWRPQWKTIDPHKYSVAKHSRTYGPLPDGRLLAGIAGHSLSFDYFGPPSKEEVAAGHSTHGEAPSVKWNFKRAAAASSCTLVGKASLPDAQINLAREICLDARNPAIYCEEIATNLATFDRPISWNEHVTFGPPFLKPAATLFDMSATRAKTSPPSFSSKPLVKSDTEFIWPNAPTGGGGRLDLRTTPDTRFGQYTAQLLDPRLDTGFIAACNPRLGLLVSYVFRRTDFPWVGNWVERFFRPHAPWNRKAFCRGLEFSTTPFAIPRRETIEQNRMFGEPVYRWLPAKSEAKIRYIILMFRVPNNFRGVKSVSLNAGKATVTERGPGARKLTTRVKKFL
jgi:hypothetical protein